MDAAGFAERIADDPETVVLDVRTAAEFAEGHLEDAVNIDVESPDFEQRLAELDPDLPYAVYCRSGNRSRVALDAMQEQGFDAAYHLEGGIGAWAEAGNPVVR